MFNSLCKLAVFFQHMDTANLNIKYKITEQLNNNKNAQITQNCYFASLSINHSCYHKENKQNLGHAWKNERQNEPRWEMDGELKYIFIQLKIIFILTRHSKKSSSLVEGGIHTAAMQNKETQMHSEEVWTVCK